MTAGGDGLRLSLADQPSTFPCSAVRRSTTSMSVMAVSIIDATFGAGGYTRDILAAPSAE